MAELIAVLGAGPMGLAVAYQLARDGYRPVVFEADNRIGGMAASFDFAGLNIERYYHFHCTSDLAFLDVLKELALTEKMHWIETKMGFWYQGRLQPWGNPWALLNFKGLSIVAKVRYGLHAYLSIKRSNWRSLDHIDAITWIKRWVGSEAYEALWKRLFDYKFYDLKYKISAAWIWSRIHRLGTSRYNMFREKLGYLEGGSETLLQALRKDIEKNGGELRLSSVVSRVLIENNKVKGVQVDDSDHLFDKVISTIPLPCVPSLIPGLSSDLLDAYRSLKNIAVVCVIVKLQKQLTENFWLNVNDPEMDIPGLVEYSNLYPLDEHVVYVPFYMPGDHSKFLESDQEFIGKVKRYLKKINPELTDHDFVASHASRYRFAQPVCEPGHLEKLPPAALPVQGLWVADTSFYYPDDRGISESIAFGRSMAKQAVS